MDYAAIAKDAGALPEAAEDIVRRCTAHFQGEEPSPAAVRTWLTETLRPVAGHLWPQAPTLPPGMEGHPTAMLTWAHDHDQMPLADRARRRPVYRPLTEKELDSLKGLPFHERHTKGREMQQTPAPSQG